jgi:hypothetical protein
LERTRGVASLSVGGNRWLGIKQLRLGQRGRAPLNFDVRGLFGQRRGAGLWYLL